MYISRSLSKELTLYTNNFFPMHKTAPSHLRYSAIVGVGGNLGDTKRRFQRLLTFLQRVKGLEVVSTSPLLKNPPFGYMQQDFFDNCVMEIKTSFEPKVFLKVLLHIEKLFSRKRSFKDAPRTLDLDLIFFDYRVIKSTFLMLPHPSWQERQSVVTPLKKLRTTYFKARKRVNII